MIPSQQYSIQENYNNTNNYKQYTITAVLHTRRLQQYQQLQTVYHHSSIPYKKTTTIPTTTNSIPITAIFHTRRLQQYQQLQTVYHHSRILYRKTTTIPTTTNSIPSSQQYSIQEDYNNTNNYKQYTITAVFYTRRLQQYQQLYTVHHHSSILYKKTTTIPTTINCIPSQQYSIQEDHNNTNNYKLYTITAVFYARRLQQYQQLQTVYHHTMSSILYN
jgi:hypothetical protein